MGREGRGMEIAGILLAVVYVKYKDHIMKQEH